MHISFFWRLAINNIIYSVIQFIGLATPGIDNWGHVSAQTHVLLVFDSNKDLKNYVGDNFRWEALLEELAFHGYWDLHWDLEVGKMTGDGGLLLTKHQFSVWSRGNEDRNPDPS